MLPTNVNPRAFEEQKLEKHPVVVLRHAPLGVVAGDAGWRRGPGTAGRSSVHGIKVAWSAGEARPQAK